MKNLVIGCLSMMFVFATVNVNAQEAVAQEVEKVVTEISDAKAKTCTKAEKAACAKTCTKAEKAACAKTCTKADAKVASVEGSKAVKSKACCAKGKDGAKTCSKGATKLASAEATDAKAEIKDVKRKSLKMKKGSLKKMEAVKLQQK